MEGSGGFSFSFVFCVCSRAKLFILVCIICSYLNFWVMHRGGGELVSCDCEVDGDGQQAVQAREGLGHGEEGVL